MPATSFNIVTASRDQYQEICEVSTKEDGWLLGVDNYDLWEKCYGQDCFLVAVDCGGNLLGHIAAIPHGENDGYIGIHYVKQAFRDQGVEAALFEEAMKKLTGRNVCSSGVANLWKDRPGFNISRPWNIVRRTGIPQLSLLELPILPEVLIASPTTDFLSQIIDYDQEVAGGVNRDAWCRLWLKHPTGYGRVALDVETGRVLGYGVISRALKIYRIGPVYADTEEIARLLVAMLIRSKPLSMGYGVSFLYRSDDLRIPKMLDELKLDAEETHQQRMYTERVIPFDEEKMYCFSDDEISVL